MGKHLAASSNPRARWMALVAGCVAVLAACGGGTTGGTSTGNTAGVAHAKANLAKYPNEVSYPPPGPAFNTSSAAGKTVEYIGVDMSVPILQTISGQLQEALGHVGAKLFICDGKGNPTEWKRCADQGIARKVAAIIVESFPPELITQSIQAASAAGIPVIDGNNGDPTATGNSDSTQPDAFLKGESARVAFEYSLSGILTADWVIADSNGTAHVLILGTSDVPNTKALINKGMEAEFATYCPGCAVTRKDVPIAQWATGLGPLTQSSLASDPTIKYVMPCFDGMSTFTNPAITQAGKASTVKVATFNADLDPMKNMAAGNLVTVDVGSQNPYEGWAYADQALRLMTGNPPVANEKVPVRVFDRNNVKGLSLTPDAEKSGIWYGPSTYKQMFLGLWGAS